MELSTTGWLSTGIEHDHHEGARLPHPRRMERRSSSRTATPTSGPGRGPLPDSRSRHRRRDRRTRTRRHDASAAALRLRADALFTEHVQRRRESGNGPPRRDRDDGDAGTLPESWSPARRFPLGRRTPRSERDRRPPLRRSPGPGATMSGSGSGSEVRRQRVAPVSGGVSGEPVRMPEPRPRMTREPWESQGPPGRPAGIPGVTGRRPVHAASGRRLGASHPRTEGPTDLRLVAPTAAAWLTAAVSVGASPGWVTVVVAVSLAEGRRTVGGGAEGRAAGAERTGRPPGSRR